MVNTYTPAPSPAGIDPKHMVNWQHYNGIIWHPKLDWLNLWTFSGHWRCFRCVRFFLLNKYIQIPLGGHLNPFEQCTQVKLDHFPWDRGEHQKKQLWKPLPERHFFNLHKIPLNCFGPKKSQKKNGWKAANLAKIFRHRSWTVSASPRCSWHFRDAMIRGQKIFRTQISCTMRGEDPWKLSSHLHCYPLKMAG